MIEYKISLIPGDGIGPELTEATLKVLDSAQKKFGIKLQIIEAEAGDDTLAKEEPHYQKILYRKSRSHTPA